MRENRMTQSTLPLAGPNALEAELRERCPMLDEISVFITTRAGFDFKVAEGRKDGAVVISIETMWWSWTRNAFVAEYDRWVAEQ